jgi:hypothetical protein
MNLTRSVGVILALSLAVLVTGADAKRSPVTSKKHHLSKVFVVKKVYIRVMTGPDCGPKPDALYLGISMNKEYPPLYRHAWGTAYVSSTPDGSSKYPVDHLQLVITMPQPHGGDGIGRGDCNNAATCDADIKYGGADAFGDFTSDWLATLTEQCYKPFSQRHRW